MQYLYILQFVSLLLHLQCIYFHHTLNMILSHVICSVYVSVEQLGSLSCFIRMDMALQPTLYFIYYNLFSVSGTTILRNNWHRLSINAINCFITLRKILNIIKKTSWENNIFLKSNNTTHIYLYLRKTIMRHYFTLSIIYVALLNQ